MKHDDMNVLREIKMMHYSFIYLNINTIFKERLLVEGQNGPLALIF